MHVDFFLGAGVENFNALDGEYPPVHIYPFLPKGVVTDVSDVIAVRV